MEEPYQKLSTVERGFLNKKKEEASQKVHKVKSEKVKILRSSMEVIYLTKDKGDSEWS